MRNVYLLIFTGLLGGCVSKEIKDFDSESLIPKDSSLILSTDSNFTTSPRLYFENFFTDQALHALIQSGLTKNPSWKAQLAKLELEKISSGIRTSESKPSLQTKLGWLDGEEKTMASNFQETKLPSLQSGALFNWEIDLWGKWKVLRKSALMHIEEAEYFKKSAKISFIHKISEIWFLLAAQEEQIQILQNAILSQETSIEYYRQRINAGLDDNITLARQSIILDQLILDQAEVLRELEVNKIRLFSLVGQPLKGKLPKTPNLLKNELPTLPNVLTKQVLKNRPDINAKEAKLRESLYLEKSSEFDLYPTLSIQTSGITMGANFSKPFEQWKAAFGPVLNFPIWNPKKKVLLQAARAESELRKEKWKESIYLAIEEIEIAVKSFVMSKNEYSIAQKLSQESSDILKTTKERFKAGLISELELLEAERQFLKTNVKRIKSRLQIFQYAIDLSKSLGLDIRKFN